MSVTMTAAPSAARRREQLLPIPDAPPVTITVLPSSLLPLNVVLNVLSPIPWSLPSTHIQTILGECAKKERISLACG